MSDGSLMNVGWVPTIHGHVRCVLSHLLAPWLLLLRLLPLPRTHV